MSYDDWKLETPEEEDYRIGLISRRRRDRAEWEEEHADYLRELQDERMMREDASEAEE
jgi:hypothetical protein